MCQLGLSSTSPWMYVDGVVLTARCLTQFLGTFVGAERQWCVQSLLGGCWHGFRSLVVTKRVQV